MVDSDHAPITQLMLTVQFAPNIPTLNAIDLADLYSPFRAEFPVFEQVQRAGPMPLDVNVTVLEPPFGLPPRYRFGDSRNEFSIFLQDDRLSLNWARINPSDGPSGYPGFDTVMHKALDYWGRISTDFAKRNITFAPLVGEIIYTNFFNAESFDRLSSIYKVINPDFKSEMMLFGFSWMEKLSAHGHMQHQISGPFLVNGETHSRTILQTTARFKVEHSWDNASDEFRRTHDEIDASFKNLVQEEFRPK